VRRDAAAVETAANRVNEIRYQLEPDLAGKVSVRDEHRDGMLVLQAARGTHSLPLMDLLDEIFAGVDEDNRGDLFELIRTLDLDLVATSESEQGFYRQLDGLAIYHLVGSPDAVLGTRTIWDGKAPHRMLDTGTPLSTYGEPDGHAP